MKTFGVSDKHTGPWLGESEKPDQALAKGRAMWGNDCPLYIAVLDVLNPADGFPTLQAFIGDVREALVEKYGSGADAVFDNKKVMSCLDQWWAGIREVELPSVISAVEEIDFMVASQVKLYSPGHDVKVGDYKP